MLHHSTPFHSFLLGNLETLVRMRKDTNLNRLRLKCDGIRAESRFRLSAKRKSPFKSARASVQATTGNRGVRISGSNAGYTMFRGSMKSTGYPLHSPVSSSLPLPCVTVCHHISTGLYTPRAADSGFRAPVKTFFGAYSKGGRAWGKGRKLGRQRPTQDGRWPKVPSTQRNHYVITYDIAAKDKNIRNTVGLRVSVICTAFPLPPRRH